MPEEKTDPEIMTETIEGIPLYLVPKAIADQIKSKGGAVFQIQVERKFHHQYTVNVETLDEHTQRVKQNDLAGKEGDRHG